MVSQLDRETTPSVTLTITTRDSGQPSLTVRTTCSNTKDDPLLKKLSTDKEYICYTQPTNVPTSGQHMPQLTNTC